MGAEGEGRAGSEGREKGREGERKRAGDVRVFRLGQSRKVLSRRGKGGKI